MTLVPGDCFRIIKDYLFLCYKYEIYINNYKNKTTTKKIAIFHALHIIDLGMYNQMESFFPFKINEIKTETKKEIHCTYIRGFLNFFNERYMMRIVNSFFNFSVKLMLAEQFEI